MPVYRLVYPLDYRYTTCTIPDDHMADLIDAGLESYPPLTLYYRYQLDREVLTRRYQTVNIVVRTRLEWMRIKGRILTAEGRRPRNLVLRSEAKLSSKIIHETVTEERGFARLLPPMGSPYSWDKIGNKFHAIIPVGAALPVLEIQDSRYWSEDAISKLIPIIHGSGPADCYIGEFSTKTEYMRDPVKMTFSAITNEESRPHGGVVWCSRSKFDDLKEVLERHDYDILPLI